MEIKNALYNRGRVDNAKDAMSHSAGKVGNLGGAINGRVSNAMPGIAGTVANIGMNALTRNPTISAGVGSATTAGLSGATAGQVAEAGVRGPAQAYGYNALSQAIGPLAGPAISVGSAMFDKAMGRNVDVARTGVKSLGSMFGSLLGAAAVPGVGSLLGMVTGAMADHSYKGGAIGDALDRRSDEGRRDRAEDSGFSRSQTSSMAEEDAAAGRHAGKQSHPSGYSVSPGLQDVDTLGRAAQGAFGSTGNGGSDKDSGGAPGRDSDSEGAGPGGHGKGGHGL